MTQLFSVKPNTVFIDKNGRATRDLFLLLNYLNTFTGNFAALVIEDAINNGVTNLAPSENAVFDALALKADASALASYLLTSTIGSTVQGHDALLDAIAALTVAAGGFIRSTGADAVAAQAILGTVSQTAGTPTGALFQEAAGSLKLPGGFMVAYGTDTSGTATATVSFGVTFAAAPVVIVNVVSPSARFGTASSITTTDFLASGFTDAGGTSAVNRGWVAFGKWF